MSIPAAELRGIQKNKKIPYFKQLSTQHESESDLLRDFEVGLRILANPSDKLHLNMLLTRWKISTENVLNDILPPDPQIILSSIEKCLKDADHIAVLSALNLLNYREQNLNFVKAMDFLYNYSESKNDEEECALIREDIAIWRNHWNFFVRAQPGGQHSLSTFLSQVALGTTQQPRQEGVALLTVHSSKGLEFDIVGIIGLTEGTFPDYRAKGPALQEEKRNMFVAITRSKRVLVLSYPKTKVMPWGSVRKQTPSRYLINLGLIKNNR